MSSRESQLYTNDFYDWQQEGSKRSAREVIPLVLELIQPTSVIDVGCGVGSWLSVFKEFGIQEYLGIDGDYVDRTQLQIPQENFWEFDLKYSLEINKRFDLVVSLEVAEHLPIECADVFVNSLTQLGSVVLFSAAIPFQGGTGHVNEQWPEYWVDKFKKNGYLVADCLRKKIWNNEKVEFWYAQNILIFADQYKLNEYPLLEKEIKKTSISQLAIVHPNLYLSRYTVPQAIVETQTDQLLTALSDQNNQVLDIEFDLRELNFIIFPDWKQPEELIYQDLRYVISTILKSKNSKNISLLIDTMNIAEEEASLILSDILMNLLMEEDIDTSEEPAISLISNLNDQKWAALSSKLNARILIERENQQAIANARAELVPTVLLNSLGDIVDTKTSVNSLNCIVKSSQVFNNFNYLGDKPRIDVVLQSSGLHGWSCSRGWVNVLEKNGLLNRVFAPVAEWEAEEPKHDDGLYEYLKNPQADIVLLLGFDWHSQPLHNSLKWQEQWNQAAIRKIAILQECYSSNLVQNTPEWRQLLSQAISSTIPCVDAFICHHEPDVQFLKEEGVTLPITFMPFAIDPEYFKAKTSFLERLNQAVFRGKITPYFTDRTYDERRKFIEALSRCKNVDLLEFQYNLLANPIESVKEYVNELNAYRLQLNLPSMSPTFTARPFEILACGGVLLQNKVIGEQSNQLFQNWKHLVYYDSDNPEDLIHKIQYLVDYPEVAKEIAAEGHKLCHEKHTLSNRIQTLLEWQGIDFEVKRGMNQSVAGFEG